MACSVLLNPLQQAVSLTLVSFRLQHYLGQRRRVRQIFTSSYTDFPLLRGSRVAAGVDHPRRKQDNGLDKDGSNLARKCRM